MNKWIFCLVSLLPFYTLAAALTGQSELQMVDQEIQSLKSSLHQYQIEEMREEVEGQGHMIADWPAYAEDVEQIRQLDEKEEQIRQQIKKLEERKAYLQQQSQINKFSK